MNVIKVVAVTAEPRMHTETLELLFDGDKQALAGTGKPYAVIIANQNYGAQTGLPSLATPFADAKALSDILIRRYGLFTELALPGGKTLPLVLKDPAKRDIERALVEVGKVTGVKDTVLVFYAGHGVEPVTSIAYWVPSDAEAGFEPSDPFRGRSAVIQRMQADRVILISDFLLLGRAAARRTARAREDRGERANAGAAQTAIAPLAHRHHVRKQRAGRRSRRRRTFESLPALCSPVSTRWSTTPSRPVSCSTATFSSRSPPTLTKSPSTGRLRRLATKRRRLRLR